MRSPSPPEPSDDARPPADDIVLPVERPGTSRRTFLKLAGFGVASATLASCSRAPVRLVVPRLDESAGPVPGRAYWVATTCDGCSARCGMLAKCRDGRPVKLEGNPEHAGSQGGLCAVGQASLIGLYDGERFDGPQSRQSKSNWNAIDGEIATALERHGKATRLLTGPITSPSTRAWIEQFVATTGAQHIEWSPQPDAALLDAYEAAFGQRVAPRVRLAQAQSIVAFDADFLGTWGAPVEQARDWRNGRDPDATPPRMSRHVHFEARLSLTGTKADERHVLAPWEVRGVLTEICRRLAKAAGSSVEIPDAAAPDHLTARCATLASELWAAREHAVVLCGSDDAGAQGLAILANQLLGSYGKTLTLDRSAVARRSDEGKLLGLVEELREGSAKVVILHDVNPAYDLPASLDFAAALGRADLVVATSPSPDETSALAHILAPVPHALESWDDAEAVTGELSLAQPTIPPLRETRTLRASLAAWLGKSGADRALVRDHWRTDVYPRAAADVPFKAWFESVLHDGFVRLPDPPERVPSAFRVAAISALLALPSPATKPASDQLALVLHTNVGMPSARHAHNPWLQELPDPLTKITWDNVATLAPATGERLGLVNGDTITLAAAAGEAEIRLPVWMQLGQHPDVVAVALGYGRSGTDRFAHIGPRWLEERLTVRVGETVGTRAADLIAVSAQRLIHAGTAVRLAATGEHVDLACTQDHHRLEVPRHLAPPRGEVRDAVRAVTLADWIEDPRQALHRHGFASHGLWAADHKTAGQQRFGLTIDLASCIGCSGCVVACQAENNVPVVGKDEVRRHREMSWLRIDRYFSGGEGYADPNAHHGAGGEHGHGDESDHTAPSSELRVSHQPMMCQHCGNAPCETVCPVLATVHSDDGLNQQVYNRCVGTRYCANNCPYKTRRFNWFDYPRNSELRNLALNPDVTVRTRGVMEKCSMCIQRIQEGRNEAARRGEPLVDGDIQTACQQSCPTSAIVFGDLNDPKSEVARNAASHRSYAVLGELGVDPGVRYMAEVRQPHGETRHE